MLNHVLFTFIFPAWSTSSEGKCIEGQMHAVFDALGERVVTLYNDSSGEAQKELRFRLFQVGGLFGMNRRSRLGMSDHVQQTPSASEACGYREITVDQEA